MMTQAGPSREPEAEAAEDFLRKVGLEPTPDAIGQLSGPFREALRVMCERGYDPEGGTWRSDGWRGITYKMLDKAGRVRFHSWLHRRFHGDSAIDLINFGGYYWRLGQEDPAFREAPWGEKGEPGDS